MIKFDEYINEDELIKLWEEGKLDEAPIQAKGWTQKSVSKFGKTVGGKDKSKKEIAAGVKKDKFKNQLKKG